MSYSFYLPKDKKQSAEVISKLIAEGKSRRNPRAVRWWTANAYMQGIREFSALDYSKGSVTIGYQDESGVLKLRYEEITAKYQAQLGRLLGLDISPRVNKKGVSLDGLRKASTGQVVLDAAMPQDKVSRLKLDIMPPILLYGTIGVGLWFEGADSQGIEVIMPWEILPIPVDISGPTDVRGLIRVRYVPLDWVKNLAITPSGKKIYEGLDEYSVPAGQMPVQIDSTGEGILSTTASGGGFFVKAANNKDAGNAWGTKGGKKKDEENMSITQLVEVWTETSDGYIAEYRVYAGISKLAELYRHDHSADKYFMPVRIIRGISVGSFWGNSYVDQLIPMNHEIEIALSGIFQAASDYDTYGFQLWPTTLGDPQMAERGQDGIKRIRYEPDYTCPDLKPENIMPAKMTNAQIQAVTVAAQMMDKIANQPSELMSGDAPGRTDSASALGLLYETSGIPLSPTAKNIAEGLSGVYRAMLRILKDNWSDSKVVNISNLDDSLAGIVLDAESGTLSLSQNAIPFPDEVSITIASEKPVSEAQQKAELKEALKEGRITLDEFNFEIRKRGLDLPVGQEARWQNYRRAMMENIILFGDGKTPGKVIVSPNDVHDVHLSVLLAFVARPEFFASSVQVREAFQAHVDEHKYSLGTYPEQLPNIEDTAAASLGQPVEGQMPMQGGMM